MSRKYFYQAVALLAVVLVALVTVLLGSARLHAGITKVSPNPPVAVTVQPTEPSKATVVRCEFLFIGASFTCGLRDQARLEGADYFCQAGMSVFNVSGCRLPDADFQRQTLHSLLAEREYGCVLIDLGENQADYPQDTLLGGYRELLNTLVRTQPQATVVLVGILDDPNEINDAIRSLAEEYHGYYIESCPDAEQFYQTLRELEE